MITEKLEAKKSNPIAPPAGLGRKQIKKDAGKNIGKKQLSGASRWLHIYLSMISFTILLFFAVTGLTLNHADWFTQGKEIIVKDSGTVNVKWVNQVDTAKINKLQLVEFFRANKDLKGAVSDFRIDDSECSITFNGPGYLADVFIERENGKYSLSITKMGIVAVLNDLHKGRDSGKAWSWVIDVSAIFMTLVSLSGIILICFLKKKRTNGLIVALVGTVICYLIYKYLIP
ncbi:PepSY-associated TM helix domain-containing protein [Pedobacter sp. MW01-1-1]|uniref:PepSY-associated TM helix domain-containing protein n=1 Tax=Pedobacter sp. MW01-1-1 TaxID=3383027 RepID=UPI003FEFDE20